jgi:NADPH:quinone reductase-like Zn-dependent oxidoreductase
VQIRGLWVTRWSENAPREEIEETYRNLAERVAAGSLLQPVDRSFALDEWSDALARLDSPDRSGKVLFSME